VADRAAGELRAAGEATLTRRRVDPGTVLTVQKLQVVRLAATGATNRDIAAHLVLSPRTIGQHLYKAFRSWASRPGTELARLDLDRLYAAPSTPPEVPACPTPPPFPALTQRSPWSHAMGAER
jgi:DNA-binding NarL/FixJ family response regulator